MFCHRLKQMGSYGKPWNLKKKLIYSVQSSLKSSPLWVTQYYSLFILTKNIYIEYSYIFLNV